MKRNNFFKFLLFICFLQSCVENDIINDTVDETLSINNPIEKLTINETYQYTTKYTDNIGITQSPTIDWSSSNQNIISVTNTGLIKAITVGEAIIIAKTSSATGKIIEIKNKVTATAETIDNSGPKQKTGTIRTTSSYALTGTFTLKEIPNSNDLELSINTDYNASTSLPGLYLYMTNNPSTNGGAKEIQKVAIFNGAHKYIITDIGINEFKYLLYWCKPFRVKVGDAEIK